MSKFSLVDLKLTFNLFKMFQYSYSCSCLIPSASPTPSEDYRYNTNLTIFAYCRDLAPSFLSLTGDWVRGDNSKQNWYHIQLHFVHCVKAFQMFSFLSHASRKGHTCTFFTQGSYEPRHEKTGFLHMRKQRRRSASR